MSQQRAKREPKVRIRILELNEPNPEMVARAIFTLLYPEEARRKGIDQRPLEVRKEKTAAG